MLTIWGRLNSHNVKKVAWAAQEIGLEHRRIDIGGKFGFTPQYLALNPNRLIPTIEDANVPGGFVLWESNAILRYLVAAHAPQLWPETPQARGSADRWMDWQFQFADAQRDAFLGLVRQSPDERDEVAIARSAEKAGAMMQILDSALALQPWLTGADFGIADIPMGVYAYTWFTLPIPRIAVPHVSAWYARLTERPGFASQVMIPLS